MAETMTEIKQLILTPQKMSKSAPDAPVISALGTSDMQESIHAMLMIKAEDQGPWLLAGIDSWIRVGRWWLMKALLSLSGVTRGSVLDPQDYLDLIKASWILVDIINVHPQRDYVHGGWQQREILALSESVQAQLKDLHDLNVYYPPPEEILVADATIWTKVPNTVIRPQQNKTYLLNEGQLQAQQNTTVIYQSFGRFVHSSDHIVNCMVVVTLDITNEDVTLICQCPMGTNLIYLKCRLPLPLQQYLMITRNTHALR